MKNSLKEQDVTILNPLGDENQLNDNIKKLASQVSETINLVNNTFNTFMNSSMIELLENNNQKLKQLNDKADKLDEILSNISNRIYKIEASIEGILEDNPNLSQEEKDYYEKKLKDLSNLYHICFNETTKTKIKTIDKLSYEMRKIIDNMDEYEHNTFEKIISSM
jgi:DNA repair ATPase RecN